jgi:hypothetical protein
MVINLAYMGAIYSIIHNYFWINNPFVKMISLFIAIINFGFLLISIRETHINRLVSNVFYGRAVDVFGSQSIKEMRDQIAEKDRKFKGVTSIALVTFHCLLFFIPLVYFSMLFLPESSCFKHIKVYLPIVMALTVLLGAILHKYVLEKIDYHHRDCKSRENLS